MEVKNNLNLKMEQKSEQENKKIPSTDQFQKEIDKKINEQNKEKKNKTDEDKNEEKNEKMVDEKPKIDTKDLTTLKLFVLPYINKDLLSVNLKDYLGIEKENKNTNLTNKILNNEKLFESIQQENLLKNNDEKKKKSNSNIIDFNPFATFEKLNNSLKEISKQENIKESKIIKELIEKLDVQKLQDSRMVEIKFDKQNIGNLMVQIVNQDNKVSVIFKTGSKFLYDELKTNQSLLKEMLENRNLKADKIIIEYEEVN